MWSSIVVQRLVDDHTNYIELDLSVRQVGRPPSTGLPATSCDNLDSYTPIEHGGLQGTDRAITTYHLPLNHGKGQCIHLSLHTQPPRLRIQKLPKSPGSLTL